MRVRVERSGGGGGRWVVHGVLPSQEPAFKGWAKEAREQWKSHRIATAIELLVFNIICLNLDRLERLQLLQRTQPTQATQAPQAP